MLIRNLARVKGLASSGSGDRLSVSFSEGSSRDFCPSGSLPLMLCISAQGGGGRGSVGSGEQSCMSEDSSFGSFVNLLPIRVLVPYSCPSIRGVFTGTVD